MRRRGPCHRNLSLGAALLIVGLLLVLIGCSVSFLVVLGCIMCCAGTALLVRCLR